MSPHFALGRENVPCVAEVVNRSLKADCIDFSPICQRKESLTDGATRRLPWNGL